MLIKCEFRRPVGDFEARASQGVLKSNFRNIVYRKLWHALRLAFLDPTVIRRLRHARSSFRQEIRQRVYIRRTTPFDVRKYLAKLENQSAEKFSTSKCLLPNKFEH